MVALSGELQIAFFLAAILTSSMKPWFVLNVFFCMFFSLNGYKFVSQYLALEEHAVTWDPDDTKTWRARPKFHLLQHILDEACKGLHPKDVWNYRDETFGYTMQQLWFRRGGKTKSPKVESESVLLRWAKAQRPGACKRLWKQSLKKLTGKPERGLMYESQ